MDATMTEPQHWTPLDAHMDKRRRQLDLSWKTLANESGVSDETIRQWRRYGYKPERVTDSARNVEKVLRWGRGSIAAVEAGGEPVALPLHEDTGATKPMREPGLPDGVSKEQLSAYAVEMYENLTLITDPEVAMLVGMIRETRRMADNPNVFDRDIQRNTG